MKGLKFLLSVGALVLALPTLAQNDGVNGGPIKNPAPGVLDGVATPIHIPIKKPMEYEYVRWADIIWSKRVFRYIDLREKQNFKLYYPLDDMSMGMDMWVKHAERWSLWTVILTHVLNGDLTIYSHYNPDYELGPKDGYQLKYPLIPEPGKDFLTDSVYREAVIKRLAIVTESFDAMKDIYGDDSVDANGNMVYYPGDTTWYQSKDIVQYRLKEDWYFDKERSMMRPRIIAIAPVVYDKNQNKQITGHKPLFWLYFPECRYVFSKYFVYNERNDAQWYSFDELFWKRDFTSQIYKESDIFDRNIEDYRKGADALMESERVKMDIFKIEHDVWSY